MLSLLVGNIYIERNIVTPRVFGKESIIDQSYFLGTVGNIEKFSGEKQEKLLD